jgi:CarD family transcriptional regulator
MTAKEHTRFNVGEWVVHYYHGVGKVKGIVEKGLDGNEKTFYKVSTKEIDYWIPVEDEDVEHIEPIRSKKDFENALEIIAQIPIPIADHHKSRKKKIHDRWLEGNLTSRAELLRDLHGRMKLEKLSFSEKEVLEKVKRYFISEWIISDKTLTKKQAKTRLRQALKLSIKAARRAQNLSED